MGFIDVGRKGRKLAEAGRSSAGAGDSVLMRARLLSKAITAVYDDKPDPSESARRSLPCSQQSAE